MKKHELKSLTPYFEWVLNWRKTFEIRLDDRNFQVGDMIVLREWTGEAYTGREISATITYATTFEQKPGYVVLGIDHPIAVNNVIRPREAIQEMLVERIKEERARRRTLSWGSGFTGDDGEWEMDEKWVMVEIFESGAMGVDVYAGSVAEASNVAWEEDGNIIMLLEPSIARRVVKEYIKLHGIDAVTEGDE